jgi:adenylate kinase
MNVPGQYQKPAALPINRKLRALLIVGPLGSGKGTQDRARDTLPRFVHCSCGEVFRSIDVDSKLGKEFFEYSRAGRFMPDAVTIELWLAHVTNITSRGLFNPISDCLVLDGIPRTPQQARFFDSSIEVKWVFNLCCPSRQALIARVRQSVLKENRPDDADESVINYRLDIYESESQPFLNHYPAKIVHAVDATHPPHLILKKIYDMIITSESCHERRDLFTEVRRQ